MKYINNNPKRPYINAELKDRLLGYLVNLCEIEAVNFLPKDQVQQAMNGIDMDLIGGMFSMFGDDRLIEYYGAGSFDFQLLLLPFAVEFYGKGGYVARDKAVLQQIELIETQLKQMKGQSAEKFTTILEGLNHLRQLFGVFFGVQ